MLLNKQSNDQWFKTTWRWCDVFVMTWTIADLLLIISSEAHFKDILFKIYTFYSRKCIWNYRLQNADHFVLASLFNTQTYKYASPSASNQGQFILETNSIVPQPCLNMRCQQIGLACWLQQDLTEDVITCYCYDKFNLQWPGNPSVPNFHILSNPWKLQSFHLNAYQT